MNESFPQDVDPTTYFCTSCDLFVIWCECDGREFKSLIYGDVIEVPND